MIEKYCHQSVQGIFAQNKNYKCLKVYFKLCKKAGPLKLIFFAKDEKQQFNDRV